jgi:desulfoferrodoxin-like iron-binding protein
MGVDRVDEKYRCKICCNEVTVCKVGGGTLVCCGQDTEKVIEILIVDQSFVKEWSGNYDKIYRGSYDEVEEIAIRDWLSTQGEPKYLNKGYFVRLGRWKTKRQISNYQANDESKIIAVTR